ncbi:MAG: nitroreductase/quinone reductase family protein [Promethearchaeota archaeon]|jgi:deazaflavin-dependent oxidoreductase (nitroreductase family)
MTQDKLPPIEEELPRPGSALYNLNHPEEELRIKTLKRFKRINKYLILPLYRLRILPLFGFGRIFLILTTKGRISGKIRRTPLEYHWIDNVITIFSGRGDDSDWLKNLRANPNDAKVKHGFHSFKPKLEFISAYEDKLKIIKWYVAEHKRSAKFLFGWRPTSDDPKTMDFSKMLDSLVMIRLHRREE